MRLECKTNFVEQHGKYIADFVRNRQKDFKKLKSKLENAEWNDEVYSDVVAQINEIAEKIAVTLDILASSARFIDEYSRDMNVYIATRNGFGV